MQAIRQIIDLKGRDLQMLVPDAFSNQTVEVTILSAPPRPAGARRRRTPTMERLLRRPIPAKDFTPLSRDECHAR
jgi:hypothetical protein